MFHHRAVCHRQTLRTSCLLAFLLGLTGTAEAADLPSFDCVIHPYKTADLSSAAPGVIEQVFVTRTEAVLADQTVATLEADIEKATVDLARARAGIKSEVALSKVDFEFSKRRKERVAWLYKRNTTTFSRLDEANRETDLSSLRLQQAKEVAAIRRLEMQRAEAQLKQKTITAPFAGYVIDVFRSKGEYVEGQPILRIAQLDPLRVEAIVPIVMFGRIEVGMKALVQPELSVNETFEGHVEVVDRVGDAASGTFTVGVTLPNPDNRLPAGLRCGLRFTDTLKSAGVAAPNPDTTPQ